MTARSRLHEPRRAAFAAAVAFACALSVAQGQAQAQVAGPPLASTAVAPAASAPAESTPAESPEAASIHKALEQRFPGASISHIGKTGYLGLYEVMLGDQLLYTDPKVTWLFVGSIYDAATRQNLTELRTRKLNRVAVDRLPMDLAFKRVKGDGSRKLYLFSDADCPFCHRLEQEMRGLDNVTIYTFMFPIDQLHPDAARKSRILWCAPDRAKAWDTYFATGKLPSNSGDCSNPVAKTQALGDSLHINATPTLIFADGTMIPGALPLPQIEKEMASAQAELAKGRAATQAAR
ncbi:MAG: DsbC family protein [Proteobacteria bacterium]|nr:DsbC family protein [Pseudomonadota bacterium]